MVDVKKYKRLVTIQYGWKKLADPEAKGKGIVEGQVFISEGTEGELIGKDKAKFGKWVLDLSDEYTKDGIETVHNFMGGDLTNEQKAAVKDIQMRYGKSREPKAGFGLFAPTPENIATMPFIREEAGQLEDVLIPVPPQHPAGMFVDFEKEDAELWASELKKLVGQPVILTGGGGMGVRFKFLEGVKVIANPHFVPGPDGKPIPKKNWVRGKDDPDEVWFVEDTSKPAKHYSVKVYLRTFPGEADMGDIHTSRQLGSWRLTALSGYGAEKLRKTWPAGWE